MMDNNEILQHTIEKYKLNLGNKFEFVGGTIIQRSEFLTYTEILFCEDGLVDENNVPYLMESVVSKGIFERDRIIVFYKEDGTRYLIPIDGDNWKLVGNNIPEYVKNIEYGKAKKIIHRNALKVEKKPTKLSKEEKKNLLNKYNKILKKGRFIFCGILTSLIWFILIALLVIFLIVELESNVFLGILTLVIGIISWIVVSFFTIRSFYKYSSLKRVNYKRAILFKGIYKTKLNAEVHGYYYNGSNWILGYYTMASGNEVILKNIRYGDIIYIYSKNENPVNEELCFFEKINVTGDGKK